MKKTMKIILALGLILGVALVAWRIRERSRFLYAGTIEATEVDLSSRITSVIAAYDVKESDPVKVGQVLMRMTCEDQQIAADLAERDFRRAERLLRSGSMPQENFDRVRFQYENAALQQEWCTIKSPLDGMVLQKYQEAGERVSPGTKLLTVADLSEVYAYIYVPEPMLGKLKLGMQVTGYLPDLGNKTFEGQIRHIRQDAEFTPKNVQTREERTRLVFGVKVYFTNPDRILKPGMPIEVKLPS